MFSVIVQMAALIACGLAWRIVAPGGLAADDLRRALTTFVYYLLLPALVLHVIWRAPLGTDSLLIALVAAVCVVAGLLLGGVAARLLVRERAMAGAVVLAAAFPNVTYMGLPLLESLYGPAGRAIAIQYDLFACTPLLITVGALVARRYGSGGGGLNPVATLLRVPPLWAAVAAIAFNLLGLPPPEWLDATLDRLAQGVVPLMLFSLGLALSLRAWRSSYLPALAPVVVIQMALLPLFALGLTGALGMEGVVRAGVVLEAGMPTMVLGLVFCDRYRLDTGLYAAAVALTTVVSFVTLPLWHALV